MPVAIRDILLTRWHSMLNLTRQKSVSWHRARLSEEAAELQKAERFIDRISEQSDVFFAISRAKFDGYPLQSRPLFWPPKNALVYMYMVCKYTSRWGFYRAAARNASARATTSINEVVNPGKDAKIQAVAKRHEVDSEKFMLAGQRLRKFWPLLP